MRSKSSFTNILFVFVIGFCVTFYLLISKVFHLEKCKRDSESTGEVLLNGFRLEDLKNAPFPPNALPLLPPPDDRNTLQFPMFTFKNDRGFGQMLFELAALFGISKTLDRVPVINSLADPKIGSRMRSEIAADFPLFALNFEEKSVEMESAFSVSLNIRYCCKFEDPQNFKSLFQQHVMFNGVYFQSYKYFDALRSEIRDGLTPQPESAVRAEAIIPADFRHDFMICVHIKQPEIKDSGLSKPSDPLFTLRATDYLVDKYKSNRAITVAVLGNDPVWAENLFHDKIWQSGSTSSPNYTAILSPGLSTTDDIAFSRNFCDVVLLSAPTSSFGWWLAYLAKESAEVYYRDPKEVNDQIVNEMRPIDFYPASWNRLRSSKINIQADNILT